LMATTEEHTLRDALLTATTEAGVLLPWAPSATGSEHCRDHSCFLVELLGHPRIQDIPLDLETGHVPPHVLAELAACRERMSGLVEWGLVTRAEWEEQHRAAGYCRFRAPLLMRGALVGGGGADGRAGRGVAGGRGWGAGRGGVAGGCAGAECSGWQ